MLSQKKLQEFVSYDPETGLFTWNKSPNRRIKIGSISGAKRSDGYICIRIDGKDYKAHRLAWLYVYGNFPEKDLDHSNEVKDDNRITNLRLASEQENLHNISSPRIDNKSGYRGVSWSKRAKKWTAQIQTNGKRKNLGYFDTVEEASETYLKAKRELHTFWREK